MYAWWPQASHRSDSVNYRVYETDGGRRLFDGEVNQQGGGGRWNHLGTWEWTNTGWGEVLISPSRSGMGTIAADAVRVVRH